ncbi:MAG: UTP--glucose-1-phosphate uridylyltransferase [Spirochaetales bacterium]|nr:UTP--glucose-1-phosphate uridylyltransferase [Spirochaetales bacterium]
MKGLIIAAGYGTRFLPVTKTIPKEMVPLVTKPAIAFIVEEFINSGIKDIVIISSRRKKSLEDYFDREVELENALLSKGKDELYELIKPYDANFSFIRQREMMGTGHALMEAESVIGNNPFVVAYPDDLHFGEVPLAKQLIEMYEKTDCSVLSTLFDPPEINSYAAIEIAEDNLHVTNIVEKPAVGQEPSREASIGRFLYTPEIFKYLREGWEKHEGGEYYHIYALKKLMDANKVVYRRLEGERFDTGIPEGFLKAIVRHACQDESLKKILKDEIAKY